MKAFAKPIRSTIVWGLISGFFYIPLYVALSLFVFWPVSLQLTLWTLLAGYGVLLTRWSSAPLRSMGVPFLLLFIAAIFIQSPPIFLFATVAVLSWIRSGICFKKNPIVRRLVAEIALGSASALLVAGAVPEADMSWALGVLMFFLIQALYFVLFEEHRDPEPNSKVDSFEKAKMAAENILDSAEKEIIIESISKQIQVGRLNPL
jgi:hypothetical protein